MKRILAVALVALALGSAPARAAGIEVGAFGGLSFPVVQDDVKQGAMFGVRVPVKLVPLFTVEPFFASSALGEAEETIGDLTYTREGFDATAFGVNAMLTLGGPVSFYPFASVGQTSLKRAGFDDSFTTFGGGLGVGISPAPKFSIHVRGELQAVVDGEASRKFGNATVGVHYALFSMP
jgi:hypothetical protein